MAKLKNPRQKGNDYELKIAKIFTNWSGRKFERVPRSGGLRWKEDNNVTGDIVSPFELKFPITIETKKREDSWDFDKLLEETSEIWKWWEQSCEDGRRVGKISWLVIGRNFRSDYLFMEKDCFEKLKVVNDKINSIPYIFLKTKKYFIYVFNLRVVLNTVTLEDVLSLKKEKQ